MELLENSFNFINIITIVLVLSCETSTSRIPRPRGVSISTAHFYNPEKNFSCFDNSKSIPFSYVNDDYCDCPDGSDEPGTAACYNGIFCCTNAGHKAQNLKSSRVNDGICDCCDGSDEYASSANCPNVCQELDRFAREEARRLALLQKVGKQLKLEFSQKGVQIKQEKKDRLVELESNREEAEKIKNEKQLLKDEIEARENAKLDHYRKLEEDEKHRKVEAETIKNREEAKETFRKFDSNQDGLVDIAELQIRQSFDKDKNGEVSEEEARYFLNQEDFVDLEKFISDVWSNIKPYLMMDAGTFKPPITANNETDDLQPETENEQDTEPLEDEEEEDEEEEEEEVPEHEDKTETISSTYDEETQKLVDQATAARNEFAQSEKALNDIDAEIKNIIAYLSNDFGPDEEYATLEGECYEYQDHEYSYKLCPFDKTTQQPKSGSSETRLGSWSRWSGPDENKYEVMFYDKGQNCWNGPQRSTTVKVICGTENKVIGVSEPNRCEYLFDFTTPAACKDLSSDSNEDIHDEL